MRLSHWQWTAPPAAAVHTLSCDPLTTSCDRWAPTTDMIRSSAPWVTSKGHLICCATHSGIPSGDDRLAQAQRLKSLTYEAFIRDNVISGIPEVVAERPRQLQEELGLTQIIYEVNFGCRIPYELQVNCIRLLTERVVPRFK